MAKSITITDRDMELAGQLATIDDEIAAIENTDSEMQLRVLILRKRIGQGKILLQTQAELGDKEFRSRIAILRADDLIHFGYMTACRYIAIAKAEELFSTDSPYLEYLPLSNYASLASIASMDEEAIKQAISDGRLTSKITRDEASALSSMSKGRVVKPSRSELQEMLEKEREVLRAQIKEQVIAEQQAQLQQAWDEIGRTRQQLDVDRKSLNDAQEGLLAKESELDQIKQQLEQTIQEKVKAEKSKDQNTVKELEEKVTELSGEVSKLESALAKDYDAHQKQTKEYNRLLGQYQNQKRTKEKLEREVEAFRTGKQVEVMADQLTDQIKNVTNKANDFASLLDTLKTDMQRANVKVTGSMLVGIMNKFITSIVRVNNVTYEIIKGSKLGIENTSPLTPVQRVDPFDEEVRLITHSDETDNSN